MSELPVNVLRYGSDEALNEPIALRAGPVTAVYQAGDIRFVRLGNREILRRVYVGVRSSDWDTILPRLRDEQIDIAEHTFQISYEAEHLHGELHFVWQATITGEEDGTITFVMDGRAQATFRTARIGLCVLHPIAECVGKPCIVERPDGGREAAFFPEHIEPHQPFTDIQAISHELLPELQAEVRFEGQVFEMEDQRNWTDASFKTYCPPLRQPYPVEVKEGTPIRQLVTVRLEGEPPTIAHEAPPLEITLDDPPQQFGRLPRIGLMVPEEPLALTEEQTARLRALNLSHLRVNLWLTRDDVEQQWTRAAQLAQKLELALEPALRLSGKAEEQLKKLAAVLKTQGTEAPVVAWLMMHHRFKTGTREWVELGRVLLNRFAPDAVFGVGTDGYFTDLNRNRPDPDGLDLVGYSVNPQVHAFDNLSLVETLAMHAQTVENASLFTGGLPVAVGPITLRSRPPREVRALHAETPDNALPPTVDPRQMSLLGAAWTAGSIKYLADAGAASATYYEPIGWRGVMEREQGSAQPELFRSVPDGVFPLYHVLADVGQFRDADVPACRASDPLRVEALALRKGKRFRMLVCNMTNLDQNVTLRGLPSPPTVQHLDETSALTAMSAPREFRREPGARLPVQDGNAMLGLRPYEVARLDF